MSTLTLTERASASKPQFFGRLAHVLVTFFDVVAEARKTAAEAHRRYPFVNW